MEKKIGIIGIGSMGSSIAIGLAKETKSELYLYNRSPEKLNALKNSIKFNACEKLEDLISANLDYLILATKPKDIIEIAKKIK